ncbi:MAG: hypothetical protein Q4E62_08860 [Sutterellaceae bacterium]|nr:hypothetical protein [Sutterellaceae bacterium]
MQTTVVWHAYPQEAPPVAHRCYLVTVNDAVEGVITTVALWFDELNGFLEYRNTAVLAWAELPPPYVDIKASKRSV